MHSFSQAILEMSNINYTDADKSEIPDESMATVEVVADLLQIPDAAELRLELVKEEVKMGSETVPKSLNKKKAQQARDSISKTIFNNIFLDIVLLLGCDLTQCH